jgi:hypothetical protein
VEYDNLSKEFKMKPYLEKLLLKTHDWESKCAMICIVQLYNFV